MNGRGAHQTLLGVSSRPWNQGEIPINWISLPLGVPGGCQVGFPLSWLEEVNPKEWKSAGSIQIFLQALESVWGWRNFLFFGKSSEAPLLFPPKEFSDQAAEGAAGFMLCKLLFLTLTPGEAPPGQRTLP